MKPVKVQKLLEIINGVIEGTPSCDEVVGVSIDSRTIKPNEIFWAISGEDRDGSQFSEQALQNSALAVVVSQQFEKQVSGPKIIVNNTLEALHQFAKWYRDQFELCLIGITGSVGKTTTREMLYSVLSRKMEGVRSQKNYNNHLGVPLTLLQIESHHDFAILEMGASAETEIYQLAKMASPQIGIITGIAPAHLGGFGSVENIVNAKAELFENLPVNGMAFINEKTKKHDSLVQKASCPLRTIGIHTDCDLNAENVIASNDGIEFSVNQNQYYVPVSGRHLLNSALFAVSVGEELGISSSEIAAGLRSMESVSGRCQVKQFKKLTLIDDTYNSSPISLSAACSLLSEWETVGRKILVTGDMLDLGESAVRYHYNAGAQIAESNIDLVIACGEYSSDLINGAVSNGLNEEYLVSFENAGDELNEHLGNIIKQDDVILVKGSRGMKMEYVIDFLSKLNTEAESSEEICA